MSFKFLPPFRMKRKENWGKNTRGSIISIIILFLILLKKKSESTARKIMLPVGSASLPCR